MLVCHCRVVNDRRIREEIARGACDTRQIADRCGAGSDCGGCVPVIDEILGEYGCPGCPMASTPAMATAGAMAPTASASVDGGWSSP